MSNIFKEGKSSNTLPPLKSRPKIHLESTDFTSREFSNREIRDVLTPRKENPFVQYLLPSPITSSVRNSHNFGKLKPKNFERPSNEDLDSPRKEKASLTINIHRNSRIAKLDELSPLTPKTKSYFINSIDEVNLKTESMTDRTSQIRKSKFPSLHLLQQKKNILSKKILEEFQKNHKPKHSREQRQSEDNIDEEANNLIVSLKAVLREIQNAIDSVKNQYSTSKVFERAVTLALESRNAELYKGIMKLHAKAMISFSDLYKAIGIFKNIKEVAANHKDYDTKMNMYKYIGRCFQKIGNHKMAAFYFTKLLQMAWLCKKPRFELLAYDMIGLQHFYLGELETAKYFHNKSVEGRTEPDDSELRKNGVKKLVYKMNEGGNHLKKINHAKTIAEEVEDYCIPLSEDDFELPINEHQYVSQIAGDQKDSLGNRERKTQKIAREKFVELKNAFFRRRMADKETHKLKKKINKPRFFFDKEKSLNIEIDDETDRGALEKSQVFLSHLSPNRAVQNFNQRDANAIINHYLAQGNGEEEQGVSVDGKEAEKLKKKLFKVRKNLELCVTQLSAQVENKVKSRVMFQDERPENLKLVKRIRQRGV